MTDYDLYKRSYFSHGHFFGRWLYVTRALRVPPLFVSLSSGDFLYDRYLAKNDNAHGRAAKHKTFRGIKFIYLLRPVRYFFFTSLISLPYFLLQLLAVHCLDSLSIAPDSLLITAQTLNCPNFATASRIVPSISRSPDVTVSRFFENLLSRQSLHTSLVTRRRRSCELAYLAPSESADSGKNIMRKSYTICRN